MTAKTLSLSAVIKKAKEDVGGYFQLARLISKASHGKVDRRKLKAIADGEEFTVSLQELSALDDFFSQFGEGLADKPLFVRQSILEGLAASDKNVFLIGAFPRDEDERNDVSLWDVRAYETIQAGMERYRKRAALNKLQDVLFRDATTGRHNQESGPAEAIIAESKQNVCAIGSPKANVGSELLLAAMLGVKPFARPKWPPPFRFYWRGEEERRGYGFQSAFEIDRERWLAQRSEEERGPSGRVQGAIVVGDNVYETVPKSRGEWDDYGVIAVQKTRKEQVRLVVGGITGPATAAAASVVVNKLNATIPEADEGKDSRVLWAVIRTTVKERQSGIGDVRYFESIELMGPLEYWPPGK